MVSFENPSPVLRIQFGQTSQRVPGETGPITLFSALMPLRLCLSMMASLWNTQRSLTNSGFIYMQPTQRQESNPTLSWVGSWNLSPRTSIFLVTSKLCFPVKLSWITPETTGQRAWPINILLPKAGLLLLSVPRSTRTEICSIIRSSQVLCKMSNTWTQRMSASFAKNLHILSSRIRLLLLVSYLASQTLHQIVP